MTPTAIHNRNTMPTRSMNGSSGHASLNVIEKTAEPRAVSSAATEVVFGQKKPSRNKAQTPGVKNPVNSWMYWNAWGKLPSNGLARIIAITIADKLAMRPVRTSSPSDSSPGLKLRYRSIVKIVEIEFIIDANDETIAAIRAANTRPRMPAGNRFMTVG